MGTTRHRRSRRLLSFTLAGLLALGGATALLVATAEPAQAAPGDVTNGIAENTPITHSPFLFTGTASPGDPITVSSFGGLGPDCHAVADGAGNWSCNVSFTGSADLTVVTATRDIDDGNPATQESEGWEYPVALPVFTTVNHGPSDFLTNNPTAPITGSGAWPTATMIVTVNGIPATCGAADGAGNWSCTPPALPDGTYPVVARQDVGGATSDPNNTTYTRDTTTFIPRFSTPFDSTLPPASTQTSDTTPTVGGGAGDAEPDATVTVYASDFGLAPPAHPNGGPGNFYCSGVADGTGAWSCTGGPLTVNHYWDFGATQVDLAGNVTGSPDDEFDIHILPPPAAPVLTSPTAGYEGIPPFTVTGTAADPAVTQTEVRIDGGLVCGPSAPPAINCPTGALGPGPHAIAVTATDTYGTSSTTNVNVTAWGPPVIDTPIVTFQTSASTVHLSGDAPVGADLVVRVDGVSQPGCTGIVAGIPEWDCTSTFQAIGSHNLTVQYTDPHGVLSPLVGPRSFDILAPLSAPVVTSPSVPYSSTDRRVHIAMSNEPEGASYIREGATNLCASVPLLTGTFTCDTVPLSVGVHHLDIAQTDQFGTLSAVAHRTVTILPPAVPQPLSMKTFGFAFRVMNPDGSPIDDAGLGTGDLVTVEATGVPPGSRLVTEIHSTPIELGSQLVGQTGVMRLTTTVPAVPPGAHQIVVTATGDGYYPAAVSEPFAVHGLKQITSPDDEVKELGDPDSVKELGSPTGDEEPSGDGSGPGDGSGSTHGFTDPTVFGSSVESPYDASAHAFALSAAGLIFSGSIAIAFLLLVGFPAELLESTIRSNYDRAFGWIGRLRRRVHRMLEPVARFLSRPWVGITLSTLAAAFILGFADPDYGFNGASVRLFLAMIISVVTINIGLSLIVMRVARRAFDVASVFKPMPAALAIIAISVLVSRSLGISPGFLFGIVLGVAYARELKLRDEARLGVLGVGLTIGAGIIAWLGYGLASLASGPGFFNNLLIEALAAITLEALGTLVVALLPIEFLDGKTIFRWSKLAWVGLYAVTALVFLFVVVPLSDNWGVMSTPVFGWGTLFVVFALVAIATWAIFQRKPRSRQPSREAAGPRRRARR